MLWCAKERPVPIFANPKQPMMRFVARQCAAMTLTVMMAVPPSCAEDRDARVHNDTIKEAPRRQEERPAGGATKNGLTQTPAPATAKPEGGKAATEKRGVPGGPLACADYGREPQSNNVTPSGPAKEVNEWGNITVAQPKIWQFERVSALLDGLLRDVEGVSMKDLLQLDPNAQNAAAVKFVQSALEAGVQFDQGAQVTNGILRKNFDLQSQEAQRRFQMDSAYIDLLSQQRNVQTAQLLAAQGTVNRLQPLADAKTITDAQQKELDEANFQVKTLPGSIDQINKSLTATNLSLTAPPNFTSTSLQPPATGADTKSTLSGFSDLLDKLPSGVKNNLSKSFETPTLPATKQLDNFITLLYERLAREISVLQDDLARSPDNVAYLLQFDVGVYPAKKAKNHNARVEFKINCPDCKVYSLYPGQSSYNLAKFTGASKHTSIWGNIITLLGFGASASYRRQVDTLQGGLTQSVYTVGFQDGVLAPDLNPDGGEKTPPDGSGAVQSFGWYYGAAPFEDSVSPGIRTTFAMVTVPRRDIDRARDILGNSSACMPFHIMSAWGMRDDPMRQRESESVVGKIGREAAWPFYNWSKTDNQHNGITDPNSRESGREPVFRERPILSMRRSATSVKLPGAPEESSIVAKRERDTLHVLRMEYNTVFEEEENGDSDTESPIVAVSSSGTATSSATTGTGNGVASVSTTVSSTTVGNEYSPLAKCAPKQCAGMLLRLDRPVDPNLIITVRGEPLKRVRDWRGRATSVLPPAQSGTDLSSSQVTNNGELGTALIKHLRSSRSLLETDDAEPNSWMALSSTEIFLNISKELATEDEFPVIQLTDSAHSVILPHDLRKGTTDLIINGLHMRAQSSLNLKKELLRAYGSENAVEAFREAGLSKDNDDAPLSAGPYPFTTYVPLFLPDYGPQRFYARLGETRNDLMIGFLPSVEEESDSRRRRAHWKEGHAQIILEDRDLDFAWSLSCFVQGDELACHLPRPAIKQVYAAYLEVCPEQSFCPAEKDSVSVLQSGLKKNFRRPEGNRPDGKEDMAAAIQFYRGKRGASTQIEGILPPRAYVSTLQAWVIQSDTDEDQVFYAAEPARIDFFPLSDDYWSSGPLKAWHFASATSEGVVVEGCNYFEDSDTHTVTFLGQFYSPEPQRLRKEGKANCQEFQMPTNGLLRPQLVYLLDGGKETGAYPTPMALGRYKVAPSFSNLRVRTKYLEAKQANSAGYQPESWTIELNAKRTVCEDSLSIPEELRTRGLTYRWMAGNEELSECKPLPLDASEENSDTKPAWKDVDPEREALDVRRETLHGLETKAAQERQEHRNNSESKNDEKNLAEAKADVQNREKHLGLEQVWRKADDGERIRLEIKIPRELYPYLSQELSVLRKSQKFGDISVAKLPNLRKLLFPTRLSLEPLSATQFVLRGENAGAISAVALQNGTSSRTFPVAPGADYALVTLPAKSSAGGGGNSQPQKPKPQAQPQQRVPAQQGTQPAPSSGTPPVSAPKPGTPAKPPAPKPSAFRSSVAGKLLMAAFRQGTTPQRGNAGTTSGAPPAGSPQRQNSGSTANNSQPGAAKPAKPATAGQQPSKTPGGGAQKQTTDAKPLDPGTYSVLALVQVNPNGKPTEYAPITVKDVKGKPLLWVVPAEPKSTEQKTPDAETNPESSCSTCVVPACVTCSESAKTEASKKQ